MRNWRLKRFPRLCCCNRFIGTPNDWAWDFLPGKPRFYPRLIPFNNLIKGSGKKWDNNFNRFSRNGKWRVLLNAYSLVIRLSRMPFGVFALCGEINAESLYVVFVQSVSFALTVIYLLKCTLSVCRLRRKCCPENRRSTICTPWSSLSIWRFAAWLQ